MLASIVSQQPALVLEDKTKTLVITDLHIGFEGALSSNEIFVGKNTTTNETVRDVLQIIKETKAESLVLLGDIKSSVKSISKNEWNDVPMFFEKISKEIDTILIPGNHDANIQRLVPKQITMISSAGMVIEDVLLTHGHTMPSENFSHVNKIIMGHVHPVFFQEDSVVNGHRVWVHLKSEKQEIFPSSNGEIDITIVPSFNRYFYATHKRKYKKSISPIIEKTKNILAAKIMTLDGTIIGNENILEQVI